MRSRTLFATPALHRRRFAQAALPAALAAVFSCALLPAAHAQDYAVSVTSLTPAGFMSAQALGISGSEQVGSGSDADGNTCAPAVDKQRRQRDGSPGAQFSAAASDGGFGPVQVGYDTDTNFTQHGLLWTGGASPAIALDPAGYDGSAAYGVDGNTQVGSGLIEESDDDFNFTIPYAMLWHGTAASAVSLHPAGYADSVAFAVSGSAQVGAGSPDGILEHALLWHGAADSVIDLHPLASYFRNSVAYGISGNAQVGFASLVEGETHAVLWRSTAQSAVDLNPAGFTRSVALAVSGETQVGFGKNAASGAAPTTALLWRGTAKGVLDLSQFLPAAFQQTSLATGVFDRDGVVNVVGSGGGGSNPDHAFLWRVVFAPTLTGISPTTRAAGTGAFTLTTTGMRFTRLSLIRWNGQPLPTVFRNSERLQATVPASLIAQAGTARVTVSTQGVDTSRGQALTVKP